MGIYQYTMRKDSIHVDGKQIGRFAFAYKLGNNWMPDGDTDVWIPAKLTGTAGRYKKNRTVCRFNAQSFLAREALPDVEYIIVGDSFKDALRQTGRTPVYRITTAQSQFTEELDTYVGDLTCFGGLYVFVPKKVMEAA